MSYNLVLTPYPNMRIERTYIRDNSFSIWHRTLNSNWYLSDIDISISKDDDMNKWLLYDKDCKTVAVIEEKSSNAQEIDLNSSQFKALRDLCRERPLFLMVTHHNLAEQYPTYYVKAANDAAKALMLKAIKRDFEYLSQANYIRFESYLRRESIPYHLVDKACCLFDKFTLPNIIDYK